VRFSAATETSGVAIARGFDHAAAAALLQGEIKGAVYSTVGAAAGAFVVAVFLRYVVFPVTTFRRRD
jgi:TPP-dependent pyruvate/acetoin dehydrogenase alpha subunit